MDILQVKELLYNKAESVEKVLKKVGCGKIRHLTLNNEIRCAIDDEPDSNGNSVRVKLDTLYVVSFSDRFQFRGDIIGFIKEKRKCTIGDSLRLICEAIGVPYKHGRNETKQIKLPFGGYYKSCKPQHEYSYDEMNTYAEDILDDLLNIPNKMFLTDGISLETQKIFNIRYDLNSNRIIIPWRNPNGEIVALVGRWNGEDYNDHNPKYKPILPVNGFQKSLLLFGYSENYNYLYNADVIYVFESEKSVLKMHSMGFYNAVAIGSHNLTLYQANLIKSLYPKHIVIAYDEDIKDTDFLKKQCQMLKYNIGFYQSKVGYIFDKNNIYLPLGSKNSPCDLGKDIFIKLSQNCVEWMEE